MAEIRLFAGDFAPRNWALCAGQLFNINTNQALFSLLGTTYGGNGQTTFALPDLRGRAPMGTGSAPAVNSYQLGEIEGTNTVTATIANLPAHTHAASGSFAVSAYSDGGTVGSPTGTYLAALPGLYSSKTPDSTLSPVSVAVNTGAAGANSPISVQQPYLGINYIICVSGIYPSRN